MQPFKNSKDIGFCKAHGIEYALNAYMSQYAKQHFPLEFYTSWLSLSGEKAEPMEERYILIQDARLHNIKVIPPSLQLLNNEFQIVNKNTIAFGLGHIRGVGQKGVEAIQKVENFDTFENFIKSSKKIKRNVAESLIKSGACDFFKLSRTYMIRVLQAVYGHTIKDDEQLPSHLKKLSNKELDYFTQNVSDYGIIGTFNKIIENDICIQKRINVIEQKIQFLQKENTVDTNTQKALWEKLYLGISLTCSAADDFAKIDDNIKTCKQAHFIKNKEKITIHCVVDDVSIRKTSEKSKTPGREFAFVNVSDNSASIQNLVIWPDLYEKVQNDIGIGTVCCIYAQKDHYKGRDNVVAQKVHVLG